MRIALVSCCLERGNLSFPLGALCIEAAISQDPVLSSNPTRHFSYLNDSDDPASAAREVLAWHPDAVGLSVYLWNRRWFDSFASCLAGSDSGQRLPADSAHSLIFAGGPEVTADFSSFDPDVYSFICAGEGETADIAALRQLQEGREPSEQGIISKANPHFSYAFAEDLSEVPSVLLSGVADRFLKKEKTALWEMTRGCPFGCAFCFESRGLPFDTTESFARSLDFAISCKPSNIDIFRLAVLPGTQLYEKSEEFHLKFDRSAPYLLESSPTFNRRGLEACLCIKEACDFIYTKGEACMWFHSLCEASGLAPSETLGRFWELCPDFTARMGCDADELYEIQDDFARLRKPFRSKRNYQFFQNDDGSIAFLEVS